MKEADELTNSPKQGKKRIRHARQRPLEAIGIIQSSMFRAEKHGLSFALMNLPQKDALGIVIYGAWHCGKCKNFQYGPITKSEKCADCEGK